VKATKNSTKITQADQEELWELPHHATQHFAGKLSLCIGIPGMLQNNDATELHNNLIFSLKIKCNFVL
jgi:hypothetical protein